MITDDILLAAGYKTHPDIWNKADTFFQKRVYGETNTRYFINIYKYVFDHRTSYEVDLQFDNASDRPHWIKFRVMEDDTVNTIEQYVENIFTAGNFVDYDNDLVV